MTDWAALLSREPAVDHGIAPSLAKYLTLLYKWSSITNLVATSTTPRDLVALHVADCLALLPHLGNASRIVDVGSGGGLPGIVLAIARPALSVTALEPVHKKHAFLATVRRELPLDNFTALAERDEQHRTRPDFRPYDLAVSRAVFALGDWLTRATDLVRPGGRILGMEGRDRLPLPPDATRHEYSVDNRTRAIIVRPV